MHSKELTLREKLKITCPCHFGLESVLKFEISKIGGENITVKDGRVSFEGGFDMVARAAFRLLNVFL